MSTLGDRARDELTRRGLLYFGDEARRQLETLERLTPHGRAAFATAAADRALRRVEAETEHGTQRRWRELVDATWACLAGDGSRLATVRDEVSRLEAYLADPGDEPPSDLADIDVDHVAAALYAAQTFVGGGAKEAAAAGGRAIDIVLFPADARLERQATEVNVFIEAAADPAVQEELRRQRADLELLVAEGITLEVLGRLRWRGDLGQGPFQE
jgi:hypothetical protein